MFRKGYMAVLTAAILGCPTAALAADDPGMGFSVGATGGTMGLGLEAGYRFNEHLGVRANGAAYSYDKSMIVGDSGTSEGFDTDGKARLKSLGVAVDLYPFGGSFRVSAGLRSNKNRFAAEAQVAGATVEVDDTTYMANEVGTLTGAATFRKTAPTLSVGWGGNFKTGIHFGVDLGVVLQGSPRLAVTSDGTLSSNPGFQADLDAQVAEWQQDVKDEKYSRFWPIIQMHLVYRF